MTKGEKSAEQQANEQRTAEITGGYAENVQREGTKQKLIEALTAKFSQKQSGISPILVLMLMIMVAGVVVYVDRKQQG